MNSHSKLLKPLLLFFLVYAGVFYARPFLIPLTIAGVLATLFLPFCNWMEKKNIPRGVAAFFSLLVIVLLLFLLSSLIAWQVVELTKDSPMIKERLLHLMATIQQYILSHLGISMERQSQILIREQPFITDLIEKIAGSLTYLLSYFILVLVYVLFLLSYRHHLKQFFLRLFPVAQKEEMDKVLYSITHVSQNYLLGLSKMIGCLWIMYGIGFSVIGIKNALFFALVCGLLEIIPYVGNLTGTTLTVLVSAAQGASFPMLAAVVATYGSIQFIQGWILEPFIVGSQVKINPLFTIIALVIGELVWGIPGVFLAIPLIAMFKVVCDHVEVLKPIGFLIGETEKRKKESGIAQRLSTLFKKKN